VADHGDPLADESVGEGVLAPLAGALPRAAVERWVAGRMGGQHTVDLFVQWLNATSDLKRLCELACIEPWGPRMKADTFIGALARTWIGYPGELRRRYAALRVLEGRFLGLSVLMSIMPGRNLQPELDEKQIHDAFVRGATDGAACARLRQRTAGAVWASRDGAPPERAELR
jgi:hypothetical protein